MVYGVASRIAEKAVRSSGIYLIERGVKLFTKYDKQIFRNLYGKSGGRGVRHGRDIGSVVGGLYQSSRTGGDELSGPSNQFQPPSRQQYKTRSGYGNKRRPSRNKCRPYYPSRRQSRSR